MEENKRGGKRLGAGRKPLPITEKKVVLSLYPTNSDLYKFGDKKKMAEEILKFIANYGKEDTGDLKVYSNFQDLTRPTNEIKPFVAPKTNYEVKIEPKPITSVLGNVEAFKLKIRETKTRLEIEAVMRDVKNALLTGGQRRELDSFAKEHSREFYND